MKSMVSKAAVAVVVLAAAMAVVWGFFVAYGYPWLSFVWATLACAAGVWVAKSARRPAVAMADVIGNIEAESPGAAAPPG